MVPKWETKRLHVIFWPPLGLLLDPQWEPKIFKNRLQRRSKMHREKVSKIDPKRVPNEVPRASQRQPKNRILEVLEYRCDAKELQKVSRHPPKLKMEPK